MTDQSVPMSSRPPETVLDPAPAAAIAAIRQASGLDPDARRREVALVVAANPTLLEGWAELAALARDPVEAYAYARVGYHRGLDALRAAGWRGSGYVRWSHETNRGFLRSLDALRRAAADIGETGEEQRCATFLRQLDPAWDPAAGTAPA